MMTGLPTISLYLFCLSIAPLFIYDQFTRGIPSRLRDAEKPTGGFGLIRADKLSAHDQVARAHGTDIIFVHGLGSNPDTTWGLKDSNWVSEFLPQDIPAALHKDVRIFFYHYDSYWKRDGVQTRLRSLGESLVDDIENGIRSEEDERTRSLVFVGHSYGGLVIKQALTQASTNVVQSTKAVVFLGTPHRGSDFSVPGSIAAWLLQPLGSNPLLLQELVSDSHLLLDLHKDFERAMTETLRVVNFYELRPTRLLKLWFFQWERFCVTEQSATYGKENFGLSVDHSGLNKYTSRDDENYKRILGKLLDIIKPITSQKQHQLYSVPITTVESYVKRAALSSKLEDELRVKSHEGGGPRVLPVHGLGGTGKSQLVRQYIEDHKNEYSPILWIDETDEESVRSSFERCAGELGLPMDLRGTQTSKLIDFSAVQAVLRWFRNRRGTDERWLVVIDNVDNHALGIRTIFPEGRNGSIVITSQDKKLLSRMKDYKEVEVGVMDPLEAKTLLVGHLKLEVNTAPDDVLVDCDKIAKKLGHLPLAVDLAGAYIGNDVDPIRSLRQYLADYEKQQDFLLESTSFCDSSASDKTVWTVWSTTIKRIEERHASLRPGLLLAFLARFRGDVVLDELLRLASLGLSTAAEGLYGDTARLPEWLANILKTDGKDWIDFYYRQGCDVLVRYSLLQRTTGPFQGVKMHGLVEWRAKKYEEEQPWEEWYLVAMLAGCVQSAKSAASPAVRRGLFTNTFGVDEKYLDRVGVKDDRKAFVWGTIDVMQLHAHQYVETEELFIRVMEISSRVLGKAHIYTLGIKVNLALMYRNQGRWSKAKELEAQVRETSKQELTREQRLELVNLVAGLALSNIERRWWEAAEGLSLKVRQICSRVLGEEHLDTVTIAASLALTYRHQGRLKESEELDLHVIGIRKRVLGEGHIDTLTSMFSLALTYYSQTRQGEAVELLMQALEIANRLLGEGHLATFQPDSTCYAGLLEAE